MMEIEFVNKYIEKLTQQIAEQSKALVFKDAQIEYLEEKLRKISSEETASKEEDHRELLNEKVKYNS